MAQGKALMSALDMSDQIATALRRQAAEPNLYGYKPHLKQIAFHSADTTGRVFCGGNRTGKTSCGVVEDIWWATKRHPYRRIPSDTEIRGRAVSVDFIAGVAGILLPVFKRWVLPSDLKNGSWEDSWDRAERRLEFVDGSFIEFKTYDQDLEKHAGTSRHFVHFDEEPPHSIFVENKMRLLDINGSWWITMTPVDGMTWVYDTLIEPKTDIDRANRCTVIEVDMDDNPYLSEEGKANLLAGMSEDEIKIRKQGKWVSKGGLIYGNFMESTHCTIPVGWLPPKDWAVWTSIDHGVNNATAIGYHAVSPSGKKIITFHEIYDNNRLVKDYAKEMLDYERANNLSVYVRTGDPAMNQRNGVTLTTILDEYRDHGIAMTVDSVTKDVTVGIEKVRKYFSPDPYNDNIPFWQFTMDCVKHATQIKRYSWASYRSPKMVDDNNPQEKPKKKDDHCCDEIRYFITCLPDLTMAAFLPEVPKIQKAAVDNEYIKTLIENSVAPQDAYRPVSNKIVWETEVGFSPTDDGEWY